MPRVCPPAASAPGELATDDLSQEELESMLSEQAPRVRAAAAMTETDMDILLRSLGDPVDTFRWSNTPAVPDILSLKDVYDDTDDYDPRRDDPRRDDPTLQRIELAVEHVDGAIGDIRDQGEILGEDVRGVQAQLELVENAVAELSAQVATQTEELLEIRATLTTMRTQFASVIRLLVSLAKSTEK